MKDIIKKIEKKNITTIYLNKTIEPVGFKASAGIQTALGKVLYIKIVLEASNMTCDSVGVFGQTHWWITN